MEAKDWVVLAAAIITVLGAVYNSIAARKTEYRASKRDKLYETYLSLLQQLEPFPFKDNPKRRERYLPFQMYESLVLEGHAHIQYKIAHDEFLRIMPLLPNKHKIVLLSILSNHDYEVDKINELRIKYQLFLYSENIECEHRILENFVSYFEAHPLFIDFLKISQDIVRIYQSYGLDLKIDSFESIASDSSFRKFVEDFKYITYNIQNINKIEYDFVKELKSALHEELSK